jgi:hypothetical protein
VNDALPEHSQSPLASVLLAWGAALLFGFALSYLLEVRRRVTSPETRGYTWGHFVGLSRFTYPLLFGGMAERGNLFFVVVLASAALYFPVGVCIIKRKRWAVVIGTILSLNPAGWFIDTIYFARRWSEFKHEAANPRLSGSDQNNGPIDLAQQQRESRAQLVEERFVLAIVLFIMLFLVVHGWNRNAVAKAPAAETARSASK